MAAIAAEISDEFGPGPMGGLVLRFLKEHRPCAVREGEDPGALICRGRNDKFRKQRPMVDDRVLDIVKRVGLEGLTNLCLFRAMGDVSDCIGRPTNNGQALADSRSLSGSLNPITKVKIQREITVENLRLEPLCDQEANTEKILYGLDDIKDKSDIIIVEGEMDKLAMEVAGFFMPTIVALFPNWATLVDMAMLETDVGDAVG